MCLNIDNEYWYSIQEARGIINGYGDTKYFIHQEIEEKIDVSNTNLYRRIQEFEKLGNNGHELPSCQPKTIMKSINGKSIKMINLTMLDDLIGFFRNKKNSNNFYRTIEKYKGEVFKYKNYYYKNEMLSEKELNEINLYLEKNYQKTVNALLDISELSSKISLDKSVSRYVYKSVDRFYVENILMMMIGNVSTELVDSIIKLDVRKSAYINFDFVVEDLAMKEKAILNSFNYSKSIIKKDLAKVLEIDLNKAERIKRELVEQEYYDLVLKSISEQVYKNQFLAVETIKKRTTVINKVLKELLCYDSEINQRLSYSVLMANI